MDAPHIFAESINAARHNHQMLQIISGDLHTIITVIDHLPKIFKIIKPIKY